MSNEESYASQEVVVVRLYVGGSEERRELLIRRLQHWQKLPGATVFHAEEGFGQHGNFRGSAAPTVVEFFDTPESAKRVIEATRDLVDHIVSWPGHAVVMDTD